MNTVLKSRRTGEDLRDHPDAPPVNPEPTDAAKCTIEIRKHNVGKHDKGNYLVFVDDVMWGRIRTAWHGVHGTTYHLSDLHAAISYSEPSKFKGGLDRLVEVTSSLPDKRAWFSEHCLGKPKDQHVARPDAEQVQVEMVRKAIADGHFRHPQVRAAEISNANARREEIGQRVNAQNKQAFEDKAREALRQLGGYIGGGYIGVPAECEAAQADVDVIIDAMKWAQSR